MTRGETAWWVAVAGQAYGPYAVDRLRAFVGEGRFAAGSLVAIEAEGPYGPAGAEPSLRELFERSVAPAAPAPRPPSLVSPSLVSPSLVSPTSPREPSGSPRVLLVAAEAPQTSPEAFEASLASLGDVVRAGPGVWFLGSAISATSLRNLLSRGLRFGERLIVAEVRSTDTAWFALDGDVDRAVRRLWEKAGA